MTQQQLFEPVEAEPDPALRELAELRRQITANWKPYTGPTLSEEECDHLVTTKINERTSECSGCGKTFPVERKHRKRRP